METFSITEHIYCTTLYPKSNVLAICIVLVERALTYKLFSRCLVSVSTLFHVTSGFLPDIFTSCSLCSAWSHWDLFAFWVLQFSSMHGWAGLFLLFTAYILLPVILLYGSVASLNFYSVWLGKLRVKSPPKKDLLYSATQLWSTWIILRWLLANIFYNFFKMSPGYFFNKLTYISCKYNSDGLPVLHMSMHCAYSSITFPFPLPRYLSCHFWEATYGTRDSFSSDTPERQGGLTTVLGQEWSLTIITWCHWASQLIHSLCISV